MAKISFRVSSKDIRKAVKSKVEDPIIALTKNPDVLRSIANEAIRIVTPYVPMKSGDLRRSGYVKQDSRGTHIVWGHPGVGRTMNYALYQHNADDTLWHRTTPGTKSYWTEELERGSYGFEELVNYAAPLMKREVKNESR